MCKENNCNCFKFAVRCAFVCLAVTAITILISIFFIAPLVAENCTAITPSVLFTVALCIALIGCCSLICITVIAVNQTKSSETRSQNLNEEILTKVIECALNKSCVYESPKSPECLHKISGEIKLKKSK